MWYIASTVQIGSLYIFYSVILYLLYIYNLLYIQIYDIFYGLSFTDHIDVIFILYRRAAFVKGFLSFIVKLAKAFRNLTNPWLVRGFLSAQLNARQMIRASRSGLNRRHAMTTKYTDRRATRTAIFPWAQVRNIARFDSWQWPEPTAVLYRIDYRYDKIDPWRIKLWWCIIPGE